MMPSDDTIAVNEPMTHNSMQLSKGTFLYSTTILNSLLLGPDYSNVCEVCP